MLYEVITLQRLAVLVVAGVAAGGVERIGRERDEDDECPTEKETINGIDDYDGCPDEGEGATRYVEDQRIDISETIHFETAKATIKVESQWVLNQVALQRNNFV